MTCPHCGFLMSPLDADCARCRHRGYVPPTPPASPTPNAPYPTPAYSYSPMPPVAPQPQSTSRALEVIACLMSVIALFGLVLFGLILHQRRNARQQAEIAALRQQLAEVQQSQATMQVQIEAPQHVRFKVREQTSSYPAGPVYVTIKAPDYDPFAENTRLHQELLNQHRDIMRQHTEEMHRLHEANVERMNANMQRMHDQMQSARQASQPRVRDLRDPFNPFGRF